MSSTQLGLYAPSSGGICLWILCKLQCNRGQQISDGAVQSTEKLHLICLQMVCPLSEHAPTETFSQWKLQEISVRRTWAKILVQKTKIIFSDVIWVRLWWSVQAVKCQNSTEATFICTLGIQRRATKHPLFDSSWLLRSAFYQTVHSLRCVSSSGLFLLMYLKITTRGCWMRCLLSHLVYSELNGYYVNDVPHYELQIETFIAALIVQTQERRCSWKEKSSQSTQWLLQI